MRKIINRKLFFTLIIALTPALAFAAGKHQEEFNGMLIGLISLIVVLLFVIGVLASVLISLAYAYRDKMRKEKSGVTGVAKTVLLLVAAGLMTTQSYAQEVVAEAPAKTVQYVNGLANSDFYIVLGMIIFELVVIIALLFVMRVMVRLMSNKYATEPTKVHIPFWDRFNQAVAIEKEQDILLDHNYDGIRELDNSLPPWWKYGFYLTIVIGVIYLYYYHAGGNGPSSYQEYIAEVEKGEADKAEYLAKSANNVDENTVKMLDATGIASGQNIFKSSCAACHAADGGGGVGPNLTDEYWLHGGSITEVFKSIKYGWPDKGMKSWKDDFSPKQIAELSSYVKSLQGTQPAAPKDKQGELYIESTTAPAEDSSKKVAINQ